MEEVQRGGSGWREGSKDGDVGWRMGVEGEVGIKGEGGQMGIG